MKKILLSCLILFLLAGCSVTRIDNYDYKALMDKVLSLDIKNYNMIGKGYKYYAPKGVVRQSSFSYNDVLKRGSNTYYLYVDVISYFYKSEIDYKVKNDVFYSNLISKNGKSGSIEIREINDKLYVQMMYNYAKIESYIKKDDLESAILDMSYIVSSVSFNDTLLKKMYSSGNLDSKDEVYKLFENKEKEGNFLEYIKEYDKYEEDELSEDEIIISEPTTTN